jgi:hypothetical protein
VAADFRLDPPVIVLFVLSRLVLVVAALVAEASLPTGTTFNPGDRAPILTSLTSWDGWHYLPTARAG